MAYAQFNFFSESLERDVPFMLYLPNDVQTDIHEAHAEAFRRPTKVLYLLNGFSGDSNSWNNQGQLRQLSETYNLAIICPDGENSFYINQKKTGGAFATYVGKELVNYVSDTFNLACPKEDTIIGGMSMGGYGALHVGLSYSETFGHIIALSPAMVYFGWRNKIIDKNYFDGVANYYYYVSTFGDLIAAQNNSVNPLIQLQNLANHKVKIPSIYIACGTEDSLVYDWNQMLITDLKSNNFNFKFEEGAGVHNFKFWNPFLVSAIESIL